MAAQHFFRFDPQESLETHIKRGIYATFKQCIRLYTLDVATAKDGTVNTLDKLSKLSIQSADDPKVSANINYQTGFLTAKAAAEVTMIDELVMHGVFGLFGFGCAEGTLGEMKDVFPAKQAFFKKLSEMWMAMKVQEVQASLQEDGDRGAYSKWMDETWFDEIKGSVSSAGA